MQGIGTKAHASTGWCVNACALCHLPHCLGTFSVVGKATEYPMMVVCSPSSCFKSL